jgi:hypothetical protein
MAATPGSRWPSISVAGWQDTRDTLHLYTQVIGKVRPANEPIATIGGTRGSTCQPAGSRHR